MTLDETAATLKLPWRTVKSRMIRAGWLLVDSGDRAGHCTHLAIASGFLAPVVEPRHHMCGPPIMVEVGYSIEPAGIDELRRMARG